MSGGGEPPDRTGRRAFFSQDQPAPAVDAAAEGRRALFSPARPAPPQRGQFIVECRTCLARTPVPLVSLPAQLIPSLWLPMRPWPRLMRCPACKRMSWCRLRFPGRARP